MGLNQSMKCPGAQRFSKVPNEINCPKCGEIVEVWSDETKRNCKKCGTAVYNANSPISDNSKKSDE